MKEDVGFHRSELGESGYPCSFVEEFCPGNLPICALGRSLSDDHLDQVHLPNHVLESAHVRIRYLAPGRDVAEGMEVL
jgi:hypothetical protein